jgi:hypothetical protein
MYKTSRNQLNTFFMLTMLTIGIILIALSAFYVSSFLAIIGVALVFWGVLLLYITPAKHVSLKLLWASTASPTCNIERILTELNLIEKGHYLPPKYLKDVESSLVFIPRKSDQPLPEPEEITEGKLFAKEQNGIFLTPPGMALSKLFEQELKTSFRKTNLAYVQQNLPKLLVDGVEIAETAEMQIKDNKITLEIEGNLLNYVCQETQKLPRTHQSVGCILTSAIACALAKATGKPITIEKEEQTPDGKITRIEYRI